MKISSTEELKAFLKQNFDSITDEQYVELLAETLGVYERKKPENVDSLIKKIDSHWRILETYKEHQELPLFFIIDGDEL
jgi:asparagine synthetase B (glutamine-hydrolysing)